MRRYNSKAGGRNDRRNSRVAAKEGEEIEVLFTEEEALEEALEEDRSRYRSRLRSSSVE